MTTNFPKKVLAYLLLLTGVVHTFNYVVDPLQVFRKQGRLEPLFSEQQRIQVPGLTRNYAESSTRLIVGSSMTANFRSTEVDAVLGGKTLKLSVNGSTAYEQTFVLRQALEAQEGSINSVIWGIDLARFNENYGEFSQPEGIYPIHLYQNDVRLLRYTLSLQTTLHSMRTILSTLLEFSFPLESRDINTLNTWNRKTGCRPVLQHLDTIMRQQSFLQDQGFTFRSDVFDAHLDDIVRIARSFPETKFYLFYSPYSIVRYKRVEQLGGLDHFMQLRKAFFDRVAEVSNIHVLDMQADASVVTNLDYYKDVGHFDNRVNNLLLAGILGQQFVSPSGLALNSERLRNLVSASNIEDIRKQCSQTP